MVPACQTGRGADVPAYSRRPHLETKSRLTAVLAAGRRVGLRVVPAVDLGSYAETLSNRQYGGYPVCQDVLLGCGANGVIEDAKPHISKQKDAPAHRFTEQEGAKEMRSVRA